MNLPEFRAAMGRAGKTNRSLAIDIGISEQALYNKINGSSEFKNSEIMVIARVLGLSMDSVNKIFFGI